MDGSYSTHEAVKYVKHFSRKIRRKEIMGDLAIDGRIILK
jgi:hypothetical protein